MEAPPPSSSSEPVITPEDVLETLMNDGTIDAIRSKIISQLKANEELKNTTVKMVEKSKVLNTPGAEKQTKRELFDALRQELETSVLEKASKSVWEMMLDNNGMGKEITDTVEKVFCRLSGKEAPLFPENMVVSQSEKLKEKETEEASRGKEEKKKHTENTHSSSKKRKVDGKGREERASEAANGSNSMSVDDSSRVPHQNAKT